MKIAIISDLLIVENNGTTITTKRLIENMKKRGHDVRIVSTLAPQEHNHFPLKKRNFYIFNKYVEKNGVVLAKPNKKLLKQVISDADVVHILLPFKTGRAAIKIANKLNIPVTTAFHVQAENVTSHFGLKNFKPANDYIYNRFYRKFFKHAKYVHCPTDFIANELRKHNYNMDLRVISNGVTPIYKKMDVEKPTELKDKFVILFIGRLVHEKRQDLLIKAAKESKYSDRIQVVFAGQGPLKEHLVSLGKGLKNPPIIQFYPKEELVKVINYSDLYVHPSDIEIEAISCLEAITCGKCPIISNSERSATNAFALTEHNLFEAGDANSLAQKIDYFIENPAELKKIEKMYNDYAKKFEIENSMNEMEKMFNDAIASKKAE